MATETRPYQILLAEDSAADVGIVRIALRDQGLDHVLHVARDGEEAINFIEKADKDRKAPGPDLLLLDMHLPKYNGEEILKCLRSTECYAQIPVVVMTSSDAPADHDRAQKHAAMFYFRKPSRLDEFIQLGIIVHDILMGKKISGSRCGRGWKGMVTRMTPTRTVRKEEITANGHANGRPKSPDAASNDALLRELQALRRSEAVLRDFIETSTIGLHWVGADGTILWANQAELDLLGYARGAVYRAEHHRISRRRGCHPRYPRLPEPRRNPARPSGAAAAPRRIDPPCPHQFERAVRGRRIRSHALLYPRHHRSQAGAGNTAGAACRGTGRHEAVAGYQRAAHRAGR